jgi:hypothetical protein
MSAIHRTKQWAKFTRMARPIITAQLPRPCVNHCGRMVEPGQRFDIGHLISHAIDPSQPLSLELVGPAHPGCNRQAGGREGRAKQLRKAQPLQQQDQRLPREGSGW